jgi:hypothetical protein
MGVAEAGLQAKRNILALSKTIRPDIYESVCYCRPDHCDYSRNEEEHDSNEKCMA